MPLYNAPLTAEYCHQICEWEKVGCAFDAVLGPDATQDDVYETVRHCTASVMQGVNRYVIISIVKLIY